MKTAHTKLIIASVFTLALLLMCNMTNAQGTANGLASSHDFVFFNFLPITLIGDTANPIPIDLDPQGAPWTKDFYDPNGIVSNGTTVGIAEYIINSGTEPWYDWHEHILPNPSGADGGYWTQVNVHVNGNPIGVNAGGLGTPDLNLTNFTQPVFPGDVMIIAKNAVVTNIQGLPGAPVLTIEEYPTPEPASAALIGMGAITLLTRGRNLGRK